MRNCGVAAPRGAIVIQPGPTALASVFRRSTKGAIVILARANGPGALPPLQSTKGAVVI